VRTLFASASTLTQRGCSDGAIDAGVISTLFREAQEAKDAVSLERALHLGFSRLSASDAFSDIDVAAQEERGDGSRAPGVRVTAKVKPRRFKLQAGATVLSSGDAQAFTEVMVPNVTGRLDSVSIKVGEDQGDVISDVASVGGLASKPAEHSSAGRGTALLRPRQSSPWVEIGYHKPTLMGTRWSLDVSARQAATSLEARQAMRLRERGVSVSVRDPSGAHSVGLSVTERAPRLFRSAPTGEEGAPSVSMETTASPEVCGDAAPSVKGALTYGFVRDWRRPTVGAANGGRFSGSVELAGIPGVSTVSHIKGETSVSLAASFGRYAPDTGYALPPTTSDAASVTTLRKLRLQAKAQGLSPHPGPAVWFPSWSERQDIIRAAHPSGDLPPRVDLPSRLSLDGSADDFSWKERVVGWLAPGLTVVLESTLGAIVPLPPAWGLGASSSAWLEGLDRGAAEAAATPRAPHDWTRARTNVVDRFQLGQPRVRGFAGEGIGPRARPVVGGTVGGDSLGGDVAWSSSVRVLGPPPLPSITLSNFGVRTQAWASVGILLPGPLYHIGAAVGDALRDHRKWSASAGLGITAPLAGMANIELNWAAVHSGPSADLRQGISLTFST
jgi:hypothetical protein